jgi:hypothetical protein
VEEAAGQPLLPGMGVGRIKEQAQGHGPGKRLVG